MDPGWLRDMGEDGLARLFLHRPDLVRPTPASLVELRSRLPHRGAVRDALRELPRPTVQVVEAMLAVGGAADRTRLLTLFGRSDARTAAAVDRALAQLVDYGLAARDRERPGRHVLVPTARDTFPSPLSLGASADEYLGRLPLPRLKAITAALGLDVGPGRAAVMVAIRTALADPAFLATVLGSAPRTVAESLRTLAIGGAVVHIPYGPFPSPSRRPRSHPGPRTGLAWAVDRCLLIPVDTHQYCVPREAALALRGPGYRAPFDPDQPPVPRTMVDDGVVAREAAAAAGALLRLAASVMDEIGRGLVATIRAGGVGLRELRRLARAAGAEPDQVRLALAALHGADLLSFVDGIAPTELYDAWLSEGPAQRLAILLAAWAALPYVPLRDRTTGVPSTVDGSIVTARRAVLRLLAAHPGAPADDASLVNLLAWSYPVLLRDLRLEPAELMAACRAEAAILGVVGAGVVSAVGRALLDGDPASLAAAGAAVGEAVRSAHLQADLTAVVAGPPTAKLAELLGTLAERETSGAASTWRFTPESIRRALDAGWSAERMLGELAAVAMAEVPQPLAYLVRDVQRRHGALRASAVACCLRSEDPALIAELAADHRLRPLELRQLAPTVIASARPLAETIDALRRAGYAPVAEAADGTTLVEHPDRRRVAPIQPPLTEAHGDGVAVFTVADARALARMLLARPDGDVPPPAGRRAELDDDIEEAAAIFGELGAIDHEEPDLFGGRPDANGG